MTQDTPNPTTLPPPLSRVGQIAKYLKEELKADIIQVQAYLERFEVVHPHPLAHETDYWMDKLSNLVTEQDQESERLRSDLDTVLLELRQRVKQAKTPVPPPPKKSWWKHVLSVFTHMQDMQG